MALVIADRVKETTTTTGTGTITLAGAVTNFETFTANLSNSDTTYYVIVDSTNNAFEVGLGTFTSSGTTLARTTIIASSNSNSAVNFGAGTKEVFITIPASKMVVKDASNAVDVPSLKIDSTAVTSSATELNILSGKSFVDEDNMASNSATGIPSQQSVKAYVDSQVTAQDLDVASDSGTIDIDLDSESLTIAGGTGLSSSASSTTVTVAVDAAQTGITSVVNSSLELGRDADNRIKFGTDNQIIFEVDGGDNVIFKTSGEIEATSLDISGDADIDGTLEADAITVNGTALNTVIAGVTVANATTAAVATTVTISDNESTNEDNAIIFTSGGDVDGGNIGLESDGDLTYNPSTGRLTATQLSGTLQTAAQANVTSLGTLTTLTVDNVIINGSTIGHTGDTDLMTVASGVLTVAGEVDATSLDISGDADIDGTLEADAITVNGTALATVIAGTTVSNATLAATVTVTDSTANTNFPVVFHDESNALLDDTGALRYNPSTGELLVPKLTVAGTTTTVDTVTMNAQNAIVFEGATADSNETTLTITDPTADRTITLPDTTGTVSLVTATETLTNKTLTTPVINGFSGTGDGSIIGDLTAKTSDGAILKLQTSDTTVVSGNYLGKIEFSAPNEASGTDAVLTAGFINSYAKGTFASNYNGADLLFGTGYSSAAAITMWLENTGLLNLYSNSRGGVPGINLRYGSTSSAQGNIIFTNSDGQLCFGADGSTSNVVFKLDDEDGQPIFTFSEEGGTVILDGGDTDVTVHKPLIANSTYTGGGLMTTGGNIVIPDAGNIGSASDTDAIAIASDGKVTFSQEIIAPSLDISGNVDIDGTLETDALSLNGTSMTATASELNLLDGGTSVGSSITVADSDGIIVNDGGTMKSVPASDIKTYAGGASKGFATAMAIAL